MRKYNIKTEITQYNPDYQFGIQSDLVYISLPRSDAKVYLRSWEGVNLFGIYTPLLEYDEDLGEGLFLRTDSWDLSLYCHMDSTIFIACHGRFPTLDDTWPYIYFVNKHTPQYNSVFYELQEAELYGYITQTKDTNLAATRQTSITQMLNQSGQMQPQKMIWKKETKGM